MPGFGVRLTAWLKCICTSAHGMGNKQEELETIVQQDNYDLVAITETWWMTLITRVLQCMAISSSEGTGKEREVVGWLCILGAVSIV